MQDLKISLVQSNLVWEDKIANLKHISDLLATKTIDADLIVLPEMFATGFSMDVDSNYSSMEGSEVHWMEQIAKKYNCLVCGSLIIKEDKKFYNRLLLVSDEGIIAQYDKRHLFSLAEEHKSFKAGHENLICSIGDWRVNFQICYDLRFPVWSRNDDSYDCLIYVANWPERRAYAWRQLLIARAIENQSYVVGVNRVGKDGNGINHIGESCGLDPMGMLMNNLSASEEVIHLQLSAQKLHETRTNLPFLQDRDQFKIV